MAGNGSGSVDDFKTRVLDAVDIVELIGQTVSLKRRGKDFVGLCPFHQEKTPSFHVSPSKQFFHCYGCKAGGNAIDFVIKRDRVVFIDALRSLGQSVGMELPQRGGSREKTGERQQLLDACSAACGLFEKLLSHPEMGLTARSYLEQRGFSAETIRQFRVGFAPDAWDTMTKSSVGRKFPAGLLQQAGLIKPRTSGDGFYDTFRNRVIFPIRDENGRVIAFGGRTMPGSDDPAKYLNSPETPLFSKGRSIFGIDLARQRIVETRTVAVVEGYTDVMMAHQFGVANVVSILGTAMTDQHVAVLRRFADRIVLLFDADEAGETAVSRAVELFLTQPVDFAVASMPEGVDPDEFLLEHGGDAFARLIADAPSVLQFMAKRFRRNWRSANNEVVGQEKAQQQFIAPFQKAKNEGGINPDRWHAVLSVLSQERGVPFTEVQRQYGGVRPMRQRASAKAAASSQPTNNAPPERHLPSGQDTAEKHILAAVLSEPERWQEIRQVVDLSDFTDDSRQRLAGAVWESQRDEGEQVFKQFLSRLEDPELKALAVELVGEIADLKSVDDALAGALLQLRDARRRRDEQKLIARLRRTDEQLGDQDQIKLLKQLQESRRQPDLKRVGS